MSESLPVPISTSLLLVLSPRTPEQEDLNLSSQKLRAWVLQAVPSQHSKRNYAKALDEVFTLCANRSQGISRPLLMEYRASMIEKRLSPSTINVRLAAIRKLISEARRNGILDAEEAAQMADVPNARMQGRRMGNWLTRDQAKQLLLVPNRSTLKGKRDYCILALLVGCALRRRELANLEIEEIQLREGRWVIADLNGKGGRVRTIAIPLWVKQAVNAWMTAAAIEEGKLLRSVTKAGKVKRDHLNDGAIWSVVESSAKEIGVLHFGAHDLRRTCAKLCRKNGGDLEQIKFLLGHSSIQTTERYLGSEQDIAVAVNDNLGL